MYVFIFWIFRWKVIGYIVVFDIGWVERRKCVVVVRGRIFKCGSWFVEVGGSWSVGVEYRKVE